MPDGDFNERHAEAVVTGNRRLHTFVFQHAAVHDLVDVLLHARQAAFDESLPIRLHLAPAGDASGFHFCGFRIHIDSFMR
ncbi:hypothetical protein D3C78_1510780 [compost metagenome]